MSNPHDAHLDTADSPVIVQSSDADYLQQLHQVTPVALAPVVDKTAPITTAALRAMRAYATAVLMERTLVIPLNKRGWLAKPTTAVKRAHRLGLQVMTWTIQGENRFLSRGHRIGTDPNATGDVPAEIRSFLAAKVDGVFTDNPDAGAAAKR